MTKGEEETVETVEAEETIASFRGHRRQLVHGVLPALLILGACQLLQDPQDPAADPHAEAPRAVAGAGCDVSGVWKLEETPQAARGCGAEESWAPFVDAILEVEQPNERLEVVYVPEEGAAMSCSGVPANDRCALEMTCTGTLRNESAEAALTLTFFPRAGTLTGTRTLDVTDTGCSMTVSIDGRRLETDTDDG